MQSLRDRVKVFAADGRFERFKTTTEGFVGSGADTRLWQ